MTDALLDQESPAVRDEPLVVVSADGHVAPLLEGYREYCPADRQQDFDEYIVTAQQTMMRLAEEIFGRSKLVMTKAAQDGLENLKTTGHLDVHARLRDMDRDGIAGEIIFHGSQGGGPIPFSEIMPTAGIDNPELAALGREMYNRWLADFCSVEPERHVGLAQLPFWDIEASVEALTLAAELGLRGVNLPAPRREITPYEDPAWEPFWAACVDLGMVLANHGGGGVTAAPATGPATMNIYTIESVAASRVSPVVRFVYGGVFERHPELKLVQTEMPGWWYPMVLDELDSQYYGFRERFDYLTRLPSDYCRTNYFIGASFQARFEAEGAIRDDVVSNVLWGSDYPHAEGTWHYTDNLDETPITRLSLRNTYSGLPDADVKAMVGENAVRVYGFDGEALQAVANRIGAPTLTEIDQPIDEVPKHWTLAFREHSYH
jgi:predicted TIM-barrel fold metal-dependent hydrolase